VRAKVKLWKCVKRAKGAKYAKCAKWFGVFGLASWAILTVPCLYAILLSVRWRADGHSCQTKVHSSQSVGTKNKWSSHTLSALTPDELTVKSRCRCDKWAEGLCLGRDRVSSDSGVAQWLANSKMDVGNCLRKTRQVWQNLTGLVFARWKNRFDFGLSQSGQMETRIAKNLSRSGCRARRADRLGVGGVAREAVMTIVVRTMESMSF